MSFSEKLSHIQYDSFKDNRCDYLYYYTKLDIYNYFNKFNLYFRSQKYQNM